MVISFYLPVNKHMVSDSCQQLGYVDFVEIYRWLIGLTHIITLIVWVDHCLLGGQVLGVIHKVWKHNMKKQLQVGPNIILRRGLGRGPYFFAHFG